MKDPQVLYVYETPRSIVTSWVRPDVSMTGRFRWLQNTYYHPEVLIFLGKSATVHRRDFFRIDQAVMHALANMGISVNVLRRPTRPGRKLRKQKIPSAKQEHLF